MELMEMELIQLLDNLLLRRRRTVPFVRTPLSFTWFISAETAESVKINCPSSFAS